MTQGSTTGSTVTQTELAVLLLAGRLAPHAYVSRTYRQLLGGGFGDQAKHPHTWTVTVQIDELPHQIISARGSARSWSSLDRLERWLREQGFRSWSVSNELEPVGESAPDDAAIPHIPAGLK